MAKEPPTTAVNRPRKAGTKSRTATRKASAAGKRKAKQAEQSRKDLSSWFYYLAMGVAAVIFTAFFYYFFIRPYAYRWKPCSGLKAYGVCLPYGYKVHGFDISHHQENINWAELSRAKHTPFPVRFVFIKASEGGDFNDSAFRQNFEQARKYGFIRGAYHFYNPNTDALRQADFFIRTVKLEPGDLPPVLDIEKKEKDIEKLRHDLKIWLDRIEAYYHVKPILYTSYKFKTRYLNDSVFNSYPYWIAHYYVDSVEYRGEWKFWQHTDAGTLPGIRKQVDLNVFNGSIEELEEMTVRSLLQDSLKNGPKKTL